MTWLLPIDPTLRTLLPISSSRMDSSIACSLAFAIASFFFSACNIAICSSCCAFICSRWYFSSASRCLFFSNQLVELGLFSCCGGFGYSAFLLALLDDAELQDQPVWRVCLELTECVSLLLRALMLIDLLIATETYLVSDLWETSVS